jgi:hypothetical protein
MGVVILFRKVAIQSADESMANPALEEHEFK